MQTAKTKLPAFIISAIILLTASCSTTKNKAYSQNWIDVFKPDSAQPTVVLYNMDRVERDFSLLSRLTTELDALMEETALLKRTYLHNKTPYLSDVDNKQAELMLFRFGNALDALRDMADYYRHATSPDAAIHTRGAIIGMNASLKHAYYSSRFVALFHTNEELIKKLNTAHPSYDIPAGFYDSVAYNVTSIDDLEQINVAWYLFCEALNHPESTLSNIRSSDPVYGKLIKQMDAIHAGLHIQMEYLLYARWSHYPELKNRLSHSWIADIGHEVSSGYDHSITASRGFIFKNVARMKSPTAHILTFSATQSDDIKSMLQPGDILLTYTAGYMSDVFLPGNFKHGITYIGTVEQRRNAGLTDETLKQRAVSERQSRELIEHVKATTTDDGYEINIVEAVAEGVVLHSLDKLLKTHINRLVVIRPKISSEERLNQLVLLMQYVGAPYDFKFDFQDDAYQCCTEVVYRTTDQKGGINYSLVEMKGRWILAADDILRYYLVQNPSAFELVLLADQSSNPHDFNAVIHTGAEGLKALYDLMETTPPVHPRSNSTTPHEAH